MGVPAARRLPRVVETTQRRLEAVLGVMKHMSAAPLEASSCFATVSKHMNSEPRWILRYVHGYQG